MIANDKYIYIAQGLPPLFGFSVMSMVMSRHAHAVQPRLLPLLLLPAMATVLLLATLGDASAAAGAEPSGMVVHADAPIAHISPYMVGAVSDHAAGATGSASSSRSCRPFLSRSHARTRAPLRRC